MANPYALNAPKPGCPAGLPSYWLWDSTAGLAFYQRTGWAFNQWSVCDEWISSDDAATGGTATIHAILHEIPKAFLVTYPFAGGFHYALPKLQPDWLDQIAGQTGISPSDIPLALFCGLIEENLSVSIDTSSHAISDLWNDFSALFHDVVSQDYVKAYGDAGAIIDKAEHEPFAEAEQDYYQVNVEGRVFYLPYGSQTNAMLAAVRTAHTNGKSIAAALESVSGLVPKQSGHIHGMSLLHQENENRAHDAVNDPLFAAYAGSLGKSAAPLAAEWLRDAGAPLPVLLGGAFRLLAASASALLAVAPPAASSAPKPPPSKAKTLGVTTIGGAGLGTAVGIALGHPIAGVLTGVALGGLGGYAYLSKNASQGNVSGSMSAVGSLPAPPPPTVGWPMSTNDVINYATYVNARMHEFSDVWDSYSHAQNWDVGGGPPGCTDAESCHPQFFTILSRANTLDSSGVVPVPINVWLAQWGAFFPTVSTDTLTLETKVQLFGGFGGPFQDVQRWHHQLQALCAKANALGLPNVPDPGGTAVPVSIAEKVKESGVPGLVAGVAESALPTVGAIAIVGVLGVGGYVAYAKRKEIGRWLRR